MPHDSPPQSRSPEELAERTVTMHTDPRFLELKRRLTVFVFPMSVAFLVWYLLYVLMSAYARGVMGTVLFGTVNVALVFGVLQFLSTFGIAVLYSRYANRRLDPLAGQLRDELTGGDGTSDAPQTAAPKGDVR
ncbi:DUF485 domain-containing protein [Streptomyces sp. TRM 70351]|uniref:DUF485 domain-containing protein n=1 Tax=Streptomyces sp. TRM 70351 TaxID=3116552 RepID=UPI002E7B35B6|nr:DUF485 domain-containing protein [Streptomyces sp. TRM 70351]MEE1930485.1 DUF485 domain-containing protein [Streptomyces sp. TRM 70351]